MLACLPFVHHSLYAGNKKSDLTVTVDASSGSYTLQSASLKWKLSGTVGQALTDVRYADGSDSIGTFKSVSFAWKANIRYTGSIRWYTDQPVAVFSLTLPDGSSGAPVAFPHFTTIPKTPYHFSYKDVDFSPPDFSLNQTSTPWLLFDQDMRACVISPASDFIVSRLSGNGTSDIQSGMNPELTQLPAGFQHSTVVVLEKGIRRAWDRWGSALRAIYHRERPANDQDPVLKYYGYWTDNGADYYYNYDTTRGYDGTLVALREHYKQEGIPLGYMQLDSWWYEKSIVDPRGKPDADHKNPALPKGPWNRYGGLMEYRADPFLFPDGLKAFGDQVGLPFVTHNRWVDPSSPYNRMFKISHYAAVDPAYWKDIMDYIKSFGVICYEQDWLNYIYDKSPAMISTLEAGNAFADGMANAAKADGIDLQYCMAEPRFFLQGVKYNNLTTIRTSGDRFEPKKWKHFIFTTQLGYEMGIWPWCDVFKSPETPNMIASVLSAGPVGTGDAIGKENKANILKACRPDGVLVKPDVPMLPVDADYLQLARGEDKPLLALTYTHHTDVTTDYLFAFADASTPDTRVSFRLSDLGIRGKAVVYQPLTRQVKVVSARDTYQDNLGPDRYNYYIVAPVTGPGIAFLGDEGKIAATGKKRIADIRTTPQSMTVQVLFAPGEPEVTLQGYYDHPVTADQGSLTLDPSTHLFTLVLPAPAGGGEATVTLK